MSLAAATCSDCHRSRMRDLALGAVAAVFFGAVLLTCGPGLFSPNQEALPLMAKQPVVLEDQRLLHVQKYEVTVAEWNRCHAAGACARELRARSGWDPETTPATGLNYVDVEHYIAWINRVSGQSFRLPTAAEWNHMAADVVPEEPDPIFTDPVLRWASAYLLENLPGRALKPTGSFPETREGVADLSGSVWEWTQDCYSGSIGAVSRENCPAFYVGGEHLAAIPYLVRDPARGGCAVGSPPAHLGLRLVSDTSIPE